jgi:hypothetical protein
MSARAWLSRETLRALPKLPSLKAWESLHHYNRKFFRTPQRSSFSPLCKPITDLIPFRLRLL